MGQPGGKLGHGLVPHAALGRVHGHGGAHIVQAQGIVVPEILLHLLRSGQDETFHRPQRNILLKGKKNIGTQSSISQNGSLGIRG